MIELDLSNLNKVDSAHGLNEEEIYSTSKKLEVFLELIHKRKQGFYKIIDDKKIVEKINKFEKIAETLGLGKNKGPVISLIK